MAKEITLDKIFSPNSAYPINNIIVDTNIIIDYKDPFGYVDPKLNNKTVEEVNKLKSHYKVNSTIVTGLEYYKYLHHGYYKIYIREHHRTFDNYSTTNFKQLIKMDSEFASGWELRLKQFKRTLKCNGRKKIPTFTGFKRPIKFVQDVPFPLNRFIKTEIYKATSIM